MKPYLRRTIGSYVFILPLLVLSLCYFLYELFRLLRLIL